MKESPGDDTDTSQPVRGVSKTSFLTLYCHEIDARSDHPILNDTRSIGIAAALDRMLAVSDDELSRDLLRRKIRPAVVTHVAMRARRYDEYVKDFLVRYPHGVVVNIGCGLDSRFTRIDNKTVQFFDLDLPGIMAVRRRFFEESERYHAIASSVLDFAWMDTPGVHRGPFLFLAEGVFMYLGQDEVRGLILELAKRFPGSELACEVVNSRWLRGSYKRVLNRKMRKQLHFGKEVSYRSGLSHTREMEEWGPGIRFLDDWSYLDSYSKRLGWLRVFRNVRVMRYSQWTVHYRLGWISAVGSTDPGNPYTA